MRLLKQHSPNSGGVYHGFNGSYQQAMQLVDLGIKIGVGGTVTYERAKKTRETIAKLPLSVLLLETDAPDMPVYGFQGKPNRPERLVNIVKAIADIRREAESEIIKRTSLTAAELFKI
jgi:TatD DNase family protein